MKLLSLRVEHFRCIEKAKIDFAEGLNLFYGPNDLGKSSLALAIRAALLLQTTAKEHEEFVSWHGTGDPFVELVFESEPQRIWRLRKTFGSASSYLEWSKDGVDFATEARGRDVDGKLSEILKWGITPPGGKKRSQGMQASFLSTVLLPEQDRVGAIFQQGLTGDSDESGKQQLVAALQAMAEDPTFKSVLERVQERVDIAFNSAGGKRRGKDSPWVKWNDEIKRKQDYSDLCLQELKKTGAIEAEIQELLGHQLAAKEAVDLAQEAIERLEQEFEKEKRRQEILARREERKARVEAIAKEVRELAEAERIHEERRLQIAALSQSREKAKAACSDAAHKMEQAKTDLDRLKSEDRVRERQLQQSGLETRLAGLKNKKLIEQSAVEGIQRVKAADEKVRKLEEELRALAKSAKDAQKKQDASRKEREELEQQERQLRGIRALLRRQTAQGKLEQAESGLAQVSRWRSEAAARLSAAADLEAAQPRFPLPSRQQLDGFRRLESDIRVAAAKVDVGLSVTVRAARPMRISVQSDGAGGNTLDLAESTFEASARRQMWLDIADLAEISISGGAADARQEAERLEQRWKAEVAPVLQAAGAATLEDLTTIVNEAAARAAAIQAARQEAAQLEQRAADQMDWAGSLAEARKELAAVEGELEGVDRPKLEKAAAKLGIKTVTETDQRGAMLRDGFARIAKEEKQQEGELLTANARTTEKQKVLDEAARELASLCAAASADRESDWQALLRQALARQEEIQTQIGRAEQELARLAAADDESVAAARKMLARREKELAEAETASGDAEKRLNEATLLHERNAGALQSRRESVAKLDEKGARELLERVDEELQATPAPQQPVSEAILAEARGKLDEAAARGAGIEGKIREKRGALQQVGGEVARQKAEDAGNELEAVKDRAHQVELEFNAWELLRKTLREAEQEEGAHLGHALAGPIARRFAALTAGRYGKLALGPDLETQGIAVAGDDRMVKLLSVGTRDQLSTLFRLTIAEELKTAVILDDQLAQSDSGRMSWLRELLKEVAANIQVIVFTCRPDDYMAPARTRRKNASDERLPAVRSVDLTQLIERWGMARAGETRSS
jgi:hypothetical protein